jgi:hypothetical protein
VNIVECIKKGFVTANKNLMLVLGLLVYNVIVSLVAVPLMGRAPAMMGAPGQAPAVPAGVGGLMIKALLFNAVVFLIWLFIQGGLLNGLKSAVATGAEVTLGQFKEGGKKYYVRLLIMSLILIVPLVLIVMGITGLGGVVASKGAAASTGTALIILLLTVVLIAYMVFLFFALFSPYGIVVGELDPIPAIKNSLNMVAKNFLKVLGILALLILIAIAIGVVLGIVLGFITFALRGVPFLVQLVNAVFTGAINAYVIVLASAALMAAYLALAEVKAPEAPQAPETPTV